MPENDSVAGNNGRREIEDQFLEGFHGGQVYAPAFWLDVVPGV